jgi:hypothetical protein
MHDYGNGLSQTHGGSKSRTNLKSPMPHTIDDSKQYKKKYEQAK